MAKQRQLLEIATLVVANPGIVGIETTVGGKTLLLSTETTLPAVRLGLGYQN